MAARAAVLRPQLQRLRADILCLQEVDAQRAKAGPHRGRRLEALDRLLQDTAYRGFHRAVSLGPAGRRPSLRHNLVVLSRWPLIAWESLSHRLVPPPRIRLATARPDRAEPLALEWDRPLLRVSVRLPNGRALHLINLHLRAPLAAAVPGQRQKSGWRS